MVSSVCLSSAVEKNSSIDEAQSVSQSSAGNQLGLNSNCTTTTTTTEAQTTAEELYFET